MTNLLKSFKLILTFTVSYFRVHCYQFLSGECIEGIISQESQQKCKLNLCIMFLLMMIMRPERADETNTTYHVTPNTYVFLLVKLQYMSIYG